MVFGGPEDDRLQINEGTLWGGSPHDYTDPEAQTRLAEIRRLIFAGKVAEAEKLSEGVMGRPKLLMPYQPFCDLRLHVPGHAQATAYSRRLRLDEAIVETSYTVGPTTFRREVFASYPDQVLVVRLTASRPGQITLQVGMDSPQAGTRVESAGQDGLQLTGQIQPRENPARSWTGSWDQPGLRFAAVLKVLTSGGSVRSAGGRLDISACELGDDRLQQRDELQELPGHWRRCAGKRPRVPDARLETALRPAAETAYRRLRPSVLTRPAAPGRCPLNRHDRPAHQELRRERGSRPARPALRVRPVPADLLVASRRSTRQPAGDLE